MKRASITIDLDSLYCYQGIYGLPVDESDNFIYDVGLERFINLMDEYDLKGTLFSVGKDLKMGDNKRVLRHLSENGHEIANHSMNHRYQLTRMSDAEIRAEVVDAKKALEDATGQKIDGFRAPGYNITRQALDIIEESGHKYDSSVFPCLPYYMAKAGVLASMAISGKKSQSILGGPEVMAAPLKPYQPGKRYWRKGGNGLLEFPISTTPVLRFPFLGSFLIIAGEKFFPILYKMLGQASTHLVLEFHGMDFVDGKADGLGEKYINQPDIGVDWSIKEKLFRKIFESLKNDYEITTLAEAEELMNGENRGG